LLISTKMKQEIILTVTIPEGVTVTLTEESMTVKGPEGEITKNINFGRLEAKLENSTFTIKDKKATKTEKKMMHTIVAHLNNMIKGVQEKFVYELKICYGHFPFTVEKNGNKAIVKNFLGEKVNREVVLMEGADVDIGKEIITIKSVNKEVAGQTAANFEAATKIKGRDKRIFQDGVYIINKAGKLV